MGHRGIPPVPVDGEKYSSVGLLGLPLVLEYDEATGGFKLVIDVENTLEVTFTGVSISVGSVAINGAVVQANNVLGAQYAEDSPHASGQTGTFILGVRQDTPASMAAEGDYTPLTTDALGRLHVFTSGSYVALSSDIQIGAVELKDGETDQRAIVHGGGSVYTDVQELGPALPLNSDTNDNTGYSGTAVLAQIVGPSGGALLRRASMGVDDDFAIRSSQYSLITASDLRIYDGASGSWVRARGDITNGLDVDVTRLPTGTVFGIGGVVDTELPAAMAVTGFLETPPDSPSVISFGYNFDYSKPSWERSASIEYSSSATIDPLGGGAGQQMQLIAGGMFARKDGTDTDWQVVLSDAQRRLHTRAFVTGTVSLDAGQSFIGMVSGTVDTELPAAAVLADNMANPTAPAVAAHLMGYDGVTWDRLYMGASGSLAVDLITALSKTTDEVTAYITGTVMVSSIGSQASEYAEDSAHTSGATGTFVLAVRQDAPSALAGEGDYSPFLTDSLGRLHVFTSGSYVSLSSDVQIGAVEIKNHSSDDRAIVNQEGQLYTAWPTGTQRYDSSGIALNALYIPFVGALPAAFNADTADYRRMQAANLSDDPNMEGNSLLAVGARGYYARGRSSDEVIFDTRVRGWATDEEVYFGNSGGGGAVGVSTLWAYDGSTGTNVYRRLQSDPVGRLHVFTSGSFVDTELPAAVALSDVGANVTAPAVGSYLMGYNEDSDIWGRLRTATEGGSLVNAEIFPALVVANLPFAFNSASSLWDRVHGGQQNSLRVANPTGTVVGGSQTAIIQRAVINASGTGGEQTLVAAAGGVLRIKVLEVMLISDATVKIFFQSGFSGTAITGPLSLPANGDGFFLKSPDNPTNFHFETAPNQALVLDRSAIAAVGGWINYYTEG